MILRRGFAALLAAAIAAAPSRAIDLVRPGSGIAATSAPQIAPAAASDLALGPVATLATESVLPGGAAFSAPVEIPAADVDSDRVGRALFDADVGSLSASDAAASMEDMVAQQAPTKLSGSFIQHEHEGKLRGAEPDDSSGDFFRYYRPAEMRSDLVAKTENSVGFAHRWVAAARRAATFWRRPEEFARWNSWTQEMRLVYSDLLEKAIVKERGPAAVRSGPESLIFQKGPSAPTWAANRLHLEAPRPQDEGLPGHQFYFPEIVSGRETPADSVDEALRRTRQVIGDTAHASAHYHVFVKVDPARLLAQIDRIDGGLQLLGDVIFAEGAYRNPDNLDHPALGPWHRGRGDRMRQIIAGKSDEPFESEDDDPNSEKRTSIAFRYWGMENGRAVISFELRGARIPWKPGPKTLVKGIDEAPPRKIRDYAEVRRWLSIVTMFAESVARDDLPPAPSAAVRLDATSVEQSMKRVAEEMGAPAGAFDGVAAYARRRTGTEGVLPGYLLPFAVDGLENVAVKNLASGLVNAAARAKFLEDSGRPRERIAPQQDIFWLAYANWSRDFRSRRGRDLEHYVRLLSRRIAR